MVQGKRVNFFVVPRKKLTFSAGIVQLVCTSWTLLFCVDTTERTIPCGMEVIERTLPADSTERYSPNVMFYFSTNLSYKRQITVNSDEITVISD